MEENYLEENGKHWNERVPIHVDSEFYGMKEFLDGQSSLKEIELGLLENVKGKSILHLQCHFGQDTLSLARIGATVTGVDLSDAAIIKAKELNTQIGTNVEFICCDVYSLKEHLNKKFDIVFTSYGTIGWLPDLDKWADIISHFLKPGGEFIFADFHPVVWMFDDHFKEIKYSYFNVETIITESQGTYTDRNADIKSKEYGWNHAIDEVLTSLIKSGLTIATFKEFDFPPYNCFQHMIKGENDRYYIEHLGKKMPMVYAIKAKY